MAVNLRGLRRFSAKIESLANINIDLILQEFLKEGQKYAQMLYQQSNDPTNTEPVKVTTEIVGDKGVIYANGKQVAYLEYGYGLEGINTYDGILPKEPITFQMGYQGEITVDGWTYYYDNPITKHDGGWDYQNDFYVGEPAEAQMWRTAIYLREQAPEIIRRVLKREYNKVNKSV